MCPEKNCVAVGDQRGNEGEVGKRGEREVKREWGFKLYPHQ